MHRINKRMTVGLLGFLLVAGGNMARAQLTITSRTNGNWNATNTWDSGTVPTGADTVTIAAAHTVTNSVSTQYAVSNLTVNGVLTHALNLKVDLLIGGDLTINAGGMIDVRNKSGDATSAGVRHGRGASHGGLGGSAGLHTGVMTYGSITNPVTPGSRGNTATYYGGGVVILRVGGQTVNNGHISADGTTLSTSNDSASSGGSINLTTGTLTGTGTNSVNGGNLLATASARAGGGGRIAVKLTSGDTFGDVVMQAYGGYSLLAGQNAAAGTIYRETASQAAVGAGNGTLIIDNRGTNTPVHTVTHVTTNIGGRTAGNIHVRNEGQFVMADDTTFVMRGDLTNDSQTNTFGGTIRVEGTGTSTFAGLSGTNVFRNLVCTIPNKQLTFHAGSLYEVTEVAIVEGDTTNNPVILRSSVEDTQWRFKTAVKEHSIRNVDVRDSDAREGVQVGAVDSINNGNNSNWVFAVSGSTNTWDGTADTDWGNGANWSLGWQPVSGETALVPSGKPHPVLDGLKIIDRLIIENTASLDLNSKNLTVRESLVVSGTVVAVAGEVLSVHGDADLTGGTITWGANSVFKLTGTGYQTVTTDGDVFRQLTVENGSGTNTFVGSFSATNMTCRLPGAVLVFDAGATNTIGNLALTGTDIKPITLRSSTPGSAWNLVVVERSGVGGVHVTDSDADGGLRIYPVMSVDGSRNENWEFGADTWKRWTGASSAVFATAGNWSPSGTPGVTNRIWIDGNYVTAPSLDAGITVTQMVVGGSAPATLTHNTTAALNVLGNVEIWNEAVVTHVLNADHSKYVNLIVGGNLTIDAGGKINVDQLASNATGASARYYGANHGGQGGYNTAENTYGSITHPTTLGSYGEGTTKPGGGVVILAVAGHTTHNGLITAAGQDLGGNVGVPSGGSINITTAFLSGSGTNTVRGGNGTSGNAPGGGGGRLAVKLTASDSFGDVTMTARGGSSERGEIYRGAAGTIYLETASHAAQGLGHGTLIIDNGTVYSPRFTLLNSSVTGKEVGDIIVRNYGLLQLTTDATLAMRGALTNDSQTNTFGGTIRVEGTGTSTFTGLSRTNVFRNLTCTNANKQLTFQAGSLVDVTGVLTLQGDTTNNPVVLRSSAEGTRWRLKIDVNEHSILNVDAQDSDAREGEQVSATDSINSGNNSNWVFSSFGAENVWNGSASDGDWGNGANWSLGWPPTLDEVAVIPVGASPYPWLDGEKVLYKLHIASGAELDLNGRNLTVSTELVVSGAVSAVQGEIVSVQGDADLTGGTITWGVGSAFKLTGTGHQTLTVDGDTFQQLTIENATGTNTFVGSLSATGLTCRVSGATLVFQAGQTNTVGDLTLHGTDTAPITLRSSTPETSWNLVVTGRSRVGGVHVTDSDADMGLTIYPVMSVDGGDNVNWEFGDASAWKRWTGASSAVFATAGNWSPSGTPGVTNRIWIDGNYATAPSLNAGITVTQMVVGGSSPPTLTHNTTAALNVLGDVEIWNEAVVTHVSNNDHSKYVNMVVGGNLDIDRGGRITVYGQSTLGWAPGTGNGGYGGSHGGRGRINTTYSTYGCITNPMTMGSHGAGSSQSGGGLVVLTVTGSTRLDGWIRADALAVGLNTSAGAGGSINLTTGTLTGTGTNSVNGGDSSGSLTCSGGGGRLAVKLTSGDSFGDVVMQARGGIYSGTLSPLRHGAAGTIYLRTAPPSAGALIIDNQALPGEANTLTDINTNVTGSVFGDLVVTNDARLFVGAERLMTLNGSLLNTATHVSHADSAWTFTGTNAAMISGDNTFGDLSIGCDPPGIKVVTFEKGKTQTVLGDLSIARAVLRSTSDNEQWYLTLDLATGTQSLIQRVAVRDSNASNGQEIMITSGGSDLGNNLNWVFPPAGTLILLR